jgi:hypothetical protein
MVGRLEVQDDRPVEVSGNSTEDGLQQPLLHLLLLGGAPWVPVVEVDFSHAHHAWQLQQLFEQTDLLLNPSLITFIVAKWLGVKADGETPSGILL